MKLSVKIISTEDEIIANCPELDINCYGNSRDEAIRRIKNVIRFYIDSARELGLDVETLDELTVEGEQRPGKTGPMMSAVNPDTIN